MLSFLYLILYFTSLIRILYLLYIFLFLFFGDMLTSNNILYGVMSGFIFSINLSAMSLLNHWVLKSSTQQELLSDWSI